MQKNGLLSDAKNDLSVLPAAWLLDLGAALRLVEWESNRLPLDDLNLPRGDAALTSVLHRWGVPDPQLALFRQMSDAYFKHFAWHGALDLGGDFVLSPIDEERFAEQIAQFLWKQRHFLESHHETSH